MRFSTILLLFAFLFQACGKDEEPVPVRSGLVPTPSRVNLVLRTQVPEKSAFNPTVDTLTYLALGDSYTIGAGVTFAERWPDQLVASIRDSEIKSRLPRYVAASGWTTASLRSAISQTNLEDKYDMVSLLIGVNNQYQGLQFAVFESEFIALLETCLRQVRSRDGVFVLSIPDYGATPFGASNAQTIRADIDRYNDFIQEVCVKNNIKFYDITPISRQAQNDLSLLASDRLHPSGKMYREWVNYIMQIPPGLLSD